MRKTRSISTVMTALLLTLVLCACGGGAAAPAAPADKAESAAAKPAESTPAKAESAPEKAESTAAPAAEVLPNIRTYSAIPDYTTETRDWNGTSCTVEVFPAGEFTPEAAFYFDESGKLVYVTKGAPVIETSVEIGETLYTINAIDDAVDESLFDISGYTISE